jgi:hypothetical protein
LTIKAHQVNRSSTTSHTLNIKNEWPNFNKHVIAVEEEEWDESNMNRPGSPLQKNSKP